MDVDSQAEPGVANPISDPRLDLAVRMSTIACAVCPVRPTGGGRRVAGKMWVGWLRGRGNDKLPSVERMLAVGYEYLLRERRDDQLQIGPAKRHEERDVWLGVRWKCPRQRCPTMQIAVRPTF